MADEKGRVAVLLSYPEPVTPLAPLGSPLGSPLSGSARSLTQQQWQVRLRAFYEPRAPADYPDLALALGHKQADVWKDSARHQLLREATLKFGQDLIVRTDADTLAPLSKLLITASPP
jgi:hypothetical protein